MPRKLVDLETQLFADPHAFTIVCIIRVLGTPTTGEVVDGMQMAFGFADCSFWRDQAGGGQAIRVKIRKLVAQGYVNRLGGGKLELPPETDALLASSKMDIAIMLQSARMFEVRMMAEALRLKPRWLLAVQTLTEASEKLDMWTYEKTYEARCGAANVEPLRQLGQTAVLVLHGLAMREPRYGNADCNNPIRWSASTVAGEVIEATVRK